MEWPLELRPANAQRMVRERYRRNAYLAEGAQGGEETGAMFLEKIISKALHGVKSA